MLSSGWTTRSRRRDASAAVSTSSGSQRAKRCTSDVCAASGKLAPGPRPACSAPLKERRDQSDLTRAAFQPVAKTTTLESSLRLRDSKSTNAARTPAARAQSVCAWRVAAGDAGVGTGGKDRPGTDHVVVHSPAIAEQSATCMALAHSTELKRRRIYDAPSPPPGKQISPRADTTQRKGVYARATTIGHASREHAEHRVDDIRIPLRSAAVLQNL